MKKYNCVLKYTFICILARKQELSQLYLLNLDIPCSTTIHVRGYSSAVKPGGCGLSWYIDNGVVSSSIKDLGEHSSTTFSKVLADWHEYRSTIFLCKILEPSESSNEVNMQPIIKSYCARDWGLIHNGSVARDEIAGVFNSALSDFEPIGSSDSELIFCHILSYMKSKNYRKLSACKFSELHKLFISLNKFGSLNLVITDGLSIVCYHDKSVNNPLYVSRIRPPSFTNVISSESVTFEMQDHNSEYRTGFLIGTKPFTDNVNEVEMAPMEMIVVRRAKYIWRSKPRYDKSIVKDENEEKETLPINFEVENKTHILNVKAITSTVDGQPLEYVSYKINHVTKYVYDKYIEKSSHVLKLQPVDDALQELLKTTLTLSLECNKLNYEDVFGNQTTYLDIDKRYNELSFHAESIVKIYACPIDDYRFKERNQEIPLFWMPWQRQMMLPYLLAPELPESQLRELVDYAMSFVERNDYHLLSTLNDINTTIYEDFTYKQGSTTLSTTPFDILRTRQGVCQDFANLFICLARLLNIPARYQVGYIYTGQNYENKEQSEASHAWVELYLPYIGWRGYDPTNGCLANQDHIRVARGRHYMDATPTSGTIFIGGGREKLTVDVSVEKIEIGNDI